MVGLALVGGRNGKETPRDWSVVLRRAPKGKHLLKVNIMSCFAGHFTCIRLESHYFNKKSHQVCIMTILPKTMYVQPVELSNAIVPSILRKEQNAFGFFQPIHPSISNERKPFLLYYFQPLPYSCECV